nr:hypothetical protein [Actinacidiphila soli]
MQATEWDHRLAVRADCKNLVSHAGIVGLLRKAADRTGLATALSAALPESGGPGLAGPRCGAGLRDRTRRDEHP